MTPAQQYVALTDRGIGKNSTTFKSMREYQAFIASLGSSVKNG